LYSFSPFFYVRFFLSRFSAGAEGHKNSQSGGTCDVECDDIDGDGGGGDDGDSDTDNDSDGNTVDDTSGSGGGDGQQDGGVENPSSSVTPEGLSPQCGSDRAALEDCLVSNGRSDDAVSNCWTCIGKILPSSDAQDCAAYEEQFCSGVAGCDSTCARSACEEEIVAAYGCESAEHSNFGCMSDMGGCETSDATAAAMAAAGLTSSLLGLLVGLLAY